MHVKLKPTNRLKLSKRWYKQLPIRRVISKHQDLLFLLRAFNKLK